MPSRFYEDTYGGALTALRHAFYDPSNNDWNVNAVDPTSQTQLNSGLGTFNSLFKQLVGRDANEGEQAQFFDTVQTNAKQFGDTFAQGTTNDYLKDFVSSRYQRQAEDQINQELVGQQDEANKLADLFRQQGSQTATSLEGQLQDFVKRTYEKVRPNLITSLQSQGLLNSGALDTAFAGKFSDLASEAQNQVSDYRRGVEEQANAIAFGGAAAPYNFKQATTLNRLPYLQNQGESSITRLFQNQMQQNAFANQMAMLNRQATLQREAQPSFLRTMGQGFAGSFGSTAGSGAANMAGSSLFGPGFASNNRGGSGSADYMKLLGMGA